MIKISNRTSDERSRRNSSIAAHSAARVFHEIARRLPSASGPQAFRDVQSVQLIALMTPRVLHRQPSGLESTDNHFEILRAPRLLKDPNVASIGFGPNHTDLPICCRTSCCCCLLLPCLDQVLPDPHRSLADSLSQLDFFWALIDAVSKLLALEIDLAPLVRFEEGQHITSAPHDHPCPITAPGKSGDSKKLICLEHLLKESLNLDSVQLPWESTDDQRPPAALG